MIDATVKTKAGQIMADLKKEDFEVREDGVAQKIALFSRDGLPLNVALVLDLSDSLGPFLGPLRDAAQKTCDLYVAIHHPKLLGLVHKPKRRAIWVHGPSSQLRHYKKVWRMWLYRPVPVLESLYQVERYSSLLPPRDPHIVIPLALPDDVRGRSVRTTVPPRRAIFASNPQRNLRR